MAAIKSFTDLEQSKKLAEILPIESADTIWDLTNPDLPAIRAIPYEDSDYRNKYLNIIPCWSLTALLGVLPIVDLCTPALKIKLNHKYYMELCIDWANQKYISTNDYDNPVDACVDMIENLHELKML